MDRILVIDDSHDLRNDIVETLAMEGFHAVGAPDGETGVRLARQVRPDLIICDIMMPGMDGYEVLDQVRGDEEIAMIPFIFLTAKTNRGDLRHGMSLGADDYITKPFMVNELLTSIRMRLKRQAEIDNMVEKRLDDLRDTIITSLPHELRTPLNTIIGFADMLMLEASHLSPEQVESWSQHIKQAGMRLYRVVENHIYYSRLQVARLQGKDRHIFEMAMLDSAHHVIREQVERIADEVDRLGDVSVELEPAPLVRFSHQDMGKLVEELVNNALKFSKPGSPILVRAHMCRDGCYALRVIDAGRGMTTAQIERIGAYTQFERGYYEQQGMGLGLAIVLELVHLYGGEISVTSEEGRGTEVEVRFALVDAS